MAEAIDALRRNWVPIFVWVSLCLAGAVAFLHAVRPQFVATAALVLEQPEVAPDGLDVVRFIHQLALDNAQAQTQLHVILSERLLRRVFDALGLAEAPKLAATSDTVVDTLSDWVRPAQTDEAPITEAERAFGRFRDRVRARRIGLSYAIEISYWAETPSQAARVANAVAAAYVRDRLDGAASAAGIGFAPVRSRVERIASEQILATESVRIGSVPDTYFPDAAVRLLGPATTSGAGTFPRAAPLLALALWFGLVSAAVVITTFRPMRRSTRLRRQIRTRFGIDCLDDAPALPGPRRGRPARARAQTLQSLRAQLAARGYLGENGRIGVLATTDGAAQRRIAAGLADLMAAARSPARLVDVAQGDAVASALDPSGAASESVETTVFAMPPLVRSAGARDLLPSLHAAILVIDARRATMSEIRASLLLLRAANVPLAAAILAPRMARVTA